LYVGSLRTDWQGRFQCGSGSGSGSLSLVRAARSSGKRDKLLCASSIILAILSNFTRAEPVACGQMHRKTGNRTEAKPLLGRYAEQFRASEALVVPSSRRVKIQKVLRVRTLLHLCMRAKFCRQRQSRSEHSSGGERGRGGWERSSGVRMVTGLWLRGRASSAIRDGKRFNSMRGN
jgi:hypothetical protein